MMHEFDIITLQNQKRFSEGNCCIGHVYNMLYFSPLSEIIINLQDMQHWLLVSNKICYKNYYILIVVLPLIMNVLQAMSLAMFLLNNLNSQGTDFAVIKLM